MLSEASKETVTGHLSLRRRAEYSEGSFQGVNPASDLPGAGKDGPNRAVSWKVLNLPYVSTVHHLESRYI